MTFKIISREDFYQHSLTTSNHSFLQSYKIRKDTIYEVKTHFGADRCCYPNRPLLLFHHLRPDGQSTGRKSAAGIAVLHDRYTGGALWVCGGTTVF